jgi:hypothetical protein
MVFGLSLSTFTILHVVISLIGIASGFVVFYELVTSKRLGGWNTLFLTTTVLTTVTGFLFPNLTLTPAVITGILSSIVLVIALFALYARHLSGGWRATYVVTALIALWFNSFVSVVQAFQKIPAFNALAPTGSEPPFLIAQFVLLAGFVIFGFLAVRRFHPAAA